MLGYEFKKLDVCIEGGFPQIRHIAIIMQPYNKTLKTHAALRYEHAQL